MLCHILLNEYGVLLNNPTQQGLKQAETRVKNFLRIVLLNNPTQQGLKRKDVLKQRRIGMIVLLNNPTQQGLKPDMLPLFYLITDFHIKISPLNITLVHLFKNSEKDVI